MAESSDELERHIQEIRHDLRDNFGELEDKVKSAVDWRAQFEERPGTMLALAFGGGILLSALLLLQMLLNLMRVIMVNNYNSV